MGNDQEKIESREKRHEAGKRGRKKRKRRRGSKSVNHLFRRIGHSPPVYTLSHTPLKPDDTCTGLHGQLTLLENNWDISLEAYRLERGVWYESMVDGVCLIYVWFYSLLLRCGCAIVVTERIRPVS